MEELNQFIRDWNKDHFSDKRRPLNKFYPSEAFQCPRKVYLKKIKRVKPNLSSAKNFYLGKMIHRLAEKAMKKRVEGEAEYDITIASNPIVISGRIDYLTPKRAIEFKTTSNLRYADSPKESHIGQLHCYMKATGRPGRLVYIDKRNLETRVFDLNFSQSIYEDVIEQFEGIHQRLKNRNPPPQPDDASYYQYPCSYCFWRKYCWGSNSEKKIKRLEEEYFNLEENKEEES